MDSNSEKPRLPEQLQSPLDSYIQYLQIEIKGLTEQGIDTSLLEARLRLLTESANRLEGEIRAAAEVKLLPANIPEQPVQDSPSEPVKIPEGPPSVADETITNIEQLRQTLLSHPALAGSWPRNEQAKETALERIINYKDVKEGLREGIEPDDQAALVHIVFLILNLRRLSARGIRDLFFNLNNLNLTDPRELKEPPSGQNLLPHIGNQNPLQGISLDTISQVSDFDNTTQGFEMKDIVEAMRIELSEWSESVFSQSQSIPDIDNIHLNPDTSITEIEQIVEEIKLQIAIPHLSPPGLVRLLTGESINMADDNWEDGILNSATRGFTVLTATKPQTLRKLDNKVWPQKTLAELSRDIKSGSIFLPSRIDLPSELAAGDYLLYLMLAADIPVDLNDLPTEKLGLLLKHLSDLEKIAHSGAEDAVAKKISDITKLRGIPSEYVSLIKLNIVSRERLEQLLAEEKKRSVEIPSVELRVKLRIFVSKLSASGLAFFLLIDAFEVNDLNDFEITGTNLQNIKTAFATLVVPQSSSQRYGYINLTRDANQDALAQLKSAIKIGTEPFFSDYPQDANEKYDLALMLMGHWPNDFTLEELVATANYYNFRDYLEPLKTEHGYKEIYQNIDGMIKAWEGGHLTQILDKARSQKLDQISLEEMKILLRSWSARFIDRDAKGNLLKDIKELPTEFIEKLVEMLSDFDTAKELQVPSLLLELLISRSNQLRVLVPVPLKEHNQQKLTETLNKIFTHFLNGRTADKPQTDILQYSGSYLSAILNELSFSPFAFLIENNGKEEKRAIAELITTCNEIDLKLARLGKLLDTTLRAAPNLRDNMNETLKIIGWNFTNSPILGTGLNQTSLESVLSYPYLNQYKTDFYSLSLFCTQLAAAMPGDVIESEEISRLLKEIYGGTIHLAQLCSSAHLTGEFYTLYKNRHRPLPDRMIITGDSNIDFAMKTLFAGKLTFDQVLKGLEMEIP